MELFFSRSFDGPICRLDADESAHCVKVLRHREGDGINVIDGEGTLYTCRILSASPKEVEAQVVGVERDWGAHPYVLRMAVCPTKNNDRFEWFAEKATELGLDVITPVIGDHSERKVFKTDRLRRILLSASKQSLKGAVPSVDEPMPLREFILSYFPEGIAPQNVLRTPPKQALVPPSYVAEGGTVLRGNTLRENVLGTPSEQVCASDLNVAEGGTVLRGNTPRENVLGTPSEQVCVSNLNVAEGGTVLRDNTPRKKEVLKLICCCYEGEEKRVSIGEVLSEWKPEEEEVPEIVVLIGPEGDFSREEVALAEKCGFRPVHLGPSRLRTETAALAAVAAVYFHYCGDKGM